jgi:DNA-binding MarR family transcriptional regulator
MSVVEDGDGDRQDVGVLLHRLLVVVADREAPLLRARDLGMWDYVVLGGLEHGPAPTQAQLAAATGRDKTRLIATLDRLQARGLVDRQPDPADRRNRIVGLTGAGRALLVDCRRAIRAMEADLLAAVAPDDAATFIRCLTDLAIVGPPTDDRSTG